MIQGKTNSYLPLAVGPLMDRGGNCAVADERRHLGEKVGRNHLDSTGEFLLNQRPANGNRVDGGHVETPKVSVLADQLPAFLESFFFILVTFDDSRNSPLGHPC